MCVTLIDDILNFYKLFSPIPKCTLQCTTIQVITGARLYNNRCLDISTCGINPCGGYKILKFFRSRYLRERGFSNKPFQENGNLVTEQNLPSGCINRKRNYCGGYEEIQKKYIS